jgi:hypothetical protein
VDNGRTPIQSWKKNSARNRPFRLSKVQEALPRSTKQEDHLGTPNAASKRQRPRFLPCERAVCISRALFLLLFRLLWSVWHLLGGLRSRLSCLSVLGGGFDEAFSKFFVCPLHSLRPHLTQDLTPLNPPLLCLHPHIAR